jgi:antitoxin component of RelBE/YafQ-DinJ toxin-antitoxin module
MNTTYPVLRIRGVFVPKNRVLHARITDETHEKLTRVCSELGCSITDYITSVLDESFEDPRGVEQTMPRTEAIVKKVSYDNGKTWIEIPELRNVSITL